jgi:hypothetical protein
MDLGLSVVRISGSREAPVRLSHVDRSTDPPTLAGLAGLLTTFAEEDG